MVLRVALLDARLRAEELVVRLGALHRELSAREKTVVMLARANRELRAGAAEARAALELGANTVDAIVHKWNKCPAARALAAGGGVHRRRQLRARATGRCG